MDSEDVYEFIKQIKRENKDLHRLFCHFEHFIQAVEKECNIPETVRDQTFKQQGMRNIFSCIATIIVNGKQRGCEESALEQLIRLCSHWSCASLYSDDRYADTERAYGENAIKLKVARWLRKRANV